MNLVVKYSITNVPNVAQMPNDATAQGITGINFIGASCDKAMALANPVAANNSNKGSILPSTNNMSKGTYVDKIVEITMPATLDATTINYLSVPLSNIGINTDIVGVEPLGLNKDEANNVASYLRHATLLNSLVFSVSKSRLIMTIPNKPFNLEFATTAADLAGVDAAAILALMNAARPALAAFFQNARLNLRITYKN